jgi:hypothetical protein
MLLGRVISDMWTPLKLSKLKEITFVQQDTGSATHFISCFQPAEKNMVNIFRGRQFYLLMEPVRGYLFRMNNTGIFNLGCRFDIQDQDRLTRAHTGKSGLVDRMDGGFLSIVRTSVLHLELKSKKNALLVQGRAIENIYLILGTFLLN